MNTNYISENQTPQEVLRMFKDQVPEFMHDWLERIVDKAREADELWEVIYNYEHFEVCNSVKDFEEELERFNDEINNEDKRIEELEEQLADCENEVFKFWTSLKHNKNRAK